MAWNVMVDLETLGNGNDAVIVAIGAVAWETGRFPDETWPLDVVDRRKFYERVTPESGVAVGMKIDASTVLWWLTQDDAARAEVVLAGTNGMAIHRALGAFQEWFLRFGVDWTTLLWGNGASFDNVILATAYAKTGVPRPWTFRQDRCYRTAVAMLDPEGKRKPADNNRKHSALADALWQAEYLDKLLVHSTVNNYEDDDEAQARSARSTDGYGGDL